MNNTKSITLSHKVSEYQRNGFYYKEIYEHIAFIAYQFPSHYFHVPQDINGDFLLFFQNKIDKMINSYKDTGTTFEAYLYTTLRFQFMTFLKKINKHNSRIRFLENKVMLDSLGVSYAKEQSHPYHADHTHINCTQENSLPFQLIMKLFSSRKIFSRKNDAFSRRVWWFTLKCTLILSENHIEKIAMLTNVPKEECHRILLNIKHHMEPTCRRKKMLIEMKNKTCLSFREIENNLYSVSLTPNESKKMQMQRQKLKTRYHKLCKLVKPEHYLVPNSILSKVLHVPKGSIDSGLYHLQQYLLTHKMPSYSHAVHH